MKIQLLKKIGLLQLKVFIAMRLAFRVD